MKIKDINLTPAELQAILERQRALATARGKKVSLEEAISDFVAHYRLSWLQEKQRRDLAAQREEIERHKYLRSEKEGFDIGRARAAEEWCAQYAGIWRAEHESLQRNGFLSMRVTVRNAAGIRLRPGAALVQLAQRFDCEVYLHRAGMVYYNFRLQGKPYLNVKSVLSLLAMTAQAGEELAWIATGPQARLALEAIATLINEGTATPEIEGVPGIETPSAAQS